jgi:hypothetical protein
VIRMEQYIPDTPAYVRVCTFPFWSQYH